MCVYVYTCIHTYIYIYKYKINKYIYIYIHTCKIDELGPIRTPMVGYRSPASDGALGVPRTLGPCDGLEALHRQPPVPSGGTLQQTNITMEKIMFDS